MFHIHLIVEIFFTPFVCCYGWFGNHCFINVDYPEASCDIIFQFLLCLFDRLFNSFVFFPIRYLRYLNFLLSNLIFFVYSLNLWWTYLFIWEYPHVVRCSFLQAHTNLFVQCILRNDVFNMLLALLIWFLIQLRVLLSLGSTFYNWLTLQANLYLSLLLTGHSAVINTFVNYASNDLKGHTNSVRVFQRV